MFRFLQLFCENGNVEMKRFLLSQTNDAEGTQKKTNSINFIETTTLLLRKLFKIMNDKVVGIPQTILDFINEITQLPCIDNQIAFMKSTFFEDLSYLADFFISEENLTTRKFHLVP
jgi:inositol 1,4,5-triphosphate receptor type 1/inositol 1,4,5-triphosphate receptor type 3